MFDFDVEVECPHCGENTPSVATYDSGLEAVTNRWTCWECDKEFSIIPPAIDVDGWDCETEE